MTHIHTSTRLLLIAKGGGLAATMGFSPSKARPLEESIDCTILTDSVMRALLFQECHHKHD